MQFLHLLAITALYLLPHATFAQSGCAEDCESCGWFCNNGCDESLDRTACNSCLYCRRESSSCDFVDVSGTLTLDAPSAELCDACSAGCWCHGDWYCMDNGGSPTPSPPTPTPTPSVLMM